MNCPNCNEELGEWAESQDPVLIGEMCRKHLEDSE
jgi:hypothetical protein